MQPHVAIIGAGPAGLAAAAAVHTAGCDPVLFDAGLPATRRDHRSARDLGIGVGGAGLFSDGKFSYFPSATRLYELPNRELLVDAYLWATNALQASGIQTEDFPYTELETSQGTVEPDGRKRYTCRLATLTQRRRLIGRLAHGRQILTRSLVTAAEKTSRGYEVIAANGVRHGPFDALVVATGRIGLAATQADFLPGRIGGRIEVGIRLDVPAHLSFFAEDSHDIKFIWSTSSGREVRTFCTCRNGEVWRVEYPWFSALSGRSDCPRTGYSNFALLARCMPDNDGYVGKNLAALIEATKEQAYWDTLPNILDGSRAARDTTRRPRRPWHPQDRIRQGRFLDLLDNETRAALLEALARLTEIWPDFLSRETLCIFPSIEGNGSYPPLQDNLRAGQEQVWFAGDAGGRFRGIVAALVSGYYVGRLAGNALLGRT